MKTKLITTLLFAALCFTAVQAQTASTDSDNTHIVAQYSTEELKEILGKADPKDVRDLFLLLPDSDYMFYFNFTIDQRKKIIKGGRVPTGSGEMGLEKIDARNGFLFGGFEGIWEMFAKKMDGIWWIAVNEQMCGESCETIQAKTYTFENGKLLQHKPANFAGGRDLKIELFIDFNQLSDAQKKQVNEIWKESSEVFFRLPRDGKTITMYIEQYPFVEAGIPENAIKEVKTNIWGF